MKHTQGPVLMSFASIIVVATLSGSTALALPGDADGSGVVDMEDARYILRGLVHQVSAPTNASDADVTQDGKVDLEDAFAIARNLTGSTRIIVLDPLYGGSSILNAGDIIRVAVYDKFSPTNLVSGTVRITSASTGYDSGSQTLIRDADGRRLQFIWYTEGLHVASDYHVQAILNGGSVVTDSELHYRSVGPTFLATGVDAMCPTPGPELVFRRTAPHVPNQFPNLGPLGRGWAHNFNIGVDELEDGAVMVHGASGLNRYFRSQPDGSFTAAPGDRGKLSMTNGTYRLREIDGFVSAFRTDRQLDYMEDKNSNRVTMIYNSSNQLVKVQHSSSNAFDITYNEHGRIATVVDHMGRVTRFAYDITGDHLTLVTHASGLSTHYEYTSGGTYLSQDRLAAVLAPDGTERHYTYDQEGRIIRQTGKNGRNPTQYVYGSDGSTRAENALGNATTTFYNERGAPVRIVDALGHMVSNAYDSVGQLVQATDPLGRSSQYEYDASGNITNILDPAVNVVRVRYDESLQKATNIVDTMGRTITFQYDADGDLTQTLYPDGTSERYTYGSSGFVTGKVDRLGRTTGYSIDSKGLLRAKARPDGRTHTLQYDDTGRLVSVQDNPLGWAVVYGYDVLGRMTQCVYSVNGMNKAFKYGYNAAGAVTNVLYPDGTTLSYAYDDIGLLTEIRDTSLGTAVVSFSYDAAERRTRKQMGNGTFSTYQYDAVNRVTNLVNCSAASNVLSRFAYVYDAVGNITLKESIEGPETYEYDALNQLTKVIYPNGVTNSFLYDAMGNRTAVLSNGVAVAYGVNDLNQYTSVGSSALTYDLNGNMVSRTQGGQTTTYEYDCENRLVGVIAPTNSVRYVYDAFGLRISSSNNTGVVYHFRDRVQVALDTDPAGTVQASYVWGGDVDEILRMNRDGSKHFYAQDALLSVVDISDVSGAPVEHYRYEVFGEPLNTSNVGNPWFYTGQQFDFLTRLQDNRLRWYSPSLGRFTSPDIIGLAGGLNLYAYVGNSPVAHRDPSGLMDAGQLANAILGVIITIVTLIGAVIGIATATTVGIAIFSGWALALSLAAIPLSVLPFLPGEPPPAITAGSSSTSGQSPSSSGNTSSGGGSPNYTSSGPSYGTGASGSGYGSSAAAAPGALPGGAQITIMPQTGDRITISPSMGGGGGEGMSMWRESAGECPTFIQPQQMTARTVLDKAQSPLPTATLSASIVVPPNDALLKSDVPIYGYACGADFLRFRVEYGAGCNPTQWVSIAESNEAEIRCPDLMDLNYMQGDLDLRGNLATWNTGLNNWEHLPWHPLGEPMDFNGIYTIRLVVEGNNGETVEDRVTCEVGRAIAQCLPGIAISPDKLVTMRFAEQSLTKNFRVYTILPFSVLGRAIPPLDDGMKLITDAYRMREPGDKFIKDVTLEFAPATSSLVGAAPERIGVCRFDSARGAWVWLPTEHDAGAKAYTTVLQELPTPEAIYALAVDSSATRSTVTELPAPPAPLAPIRPGVLVENTFEKDIGMVKLRDRIVGATLARVERNPGDFCLQLKNENFGGNFSCTLLDRPFDVREYPQLTFDYRVEADVKVNLLFKVNGRWYSLGFTDDPVDYFGKDVNIANLGDLPTVVANGQWHTATMDMERLLRKKTGHTVVEEIIFADWNDGGYMALDFGQNKRGSVLLVDNIRIAESGLKAISEPAVLWVDQFDRQDRKNGLDLPTAHYGSEPQACVASRIASGREHGACLALDVDVSKPGRYGGYWSRLGDRDVSAHDFLCLEIQATNGIQPMIAVKDAEEREIKVPALRYASEPTKNGWRSIQIPLAGLGGAVDLEHLAYVSLGVGHGKGEPRGRILLDDIRLEKRDTSHPQPIWIDDFEGEDWQQNLAGGKSFEFVGGAASIRCGLDSKRAMADRGQSLMISYGGSIGLDLVKDGFSYCGWAAKIGGVDLSSHQALEMRVRGNQGGEKPNVYLTDGVIKRGLDIEKYGAVATSWSVVQIPLKDFAGKGIDLTHVDGVKFIFEWDAMSGTIWVDDIQIK